MITLPKSVNSNVLLRLILIATLVLLPTIGFSLGFKYASNNKEPLPSPTPINIESSVQTEQNEKKLIETSLSRGLSNIFQYKKVSPSANYKCFTEGNQTSQDSKITLVKTDIEKRNRIINTLCMNYTTNKNVLVVSSEKTTTQEQKPSLLFDNYGFYEADIPSNFIVDNIYQDLKDGMKRSIRIDDWLINEDVLYTVFEPYPYNSIAKTYCYNRRLTSGGSLLIEYCTLSSKAIQPTKETTFPICNSINKSNKSQYFDKKDLPLP